MGKTAESLRRDAIALANRGELAGAQRLLLRARTMTADEDLLARISGTLAVTYARTGEVDRAEQTCAEALATPGLARETVAILEGQMGSIAGIAGRLDDADHWLSRGISRISAPEAQANLLMNRSVLRMQRRDLDRAADDSRTAAAIYQDAGLDVDAAEARHNLGYVDMLRGDLVAAITEMTSARETLAHASQVSAAICDVDRAEVLREAGLTREAEELLGDAAEVFGEMHMPKERAAAEFHLAQSLLVHDPVRARGVAAEAVDRFQSVGHDPWRARAEALRLRAELSAGQLLRLGGSAPDPGTTPTPAVVDRAVSDLEAHGLRNEAAALRMSHQLWLARHGETDGHAALRVPASATLDVQLLADEVRAERSAARRRHTQARAQAARGLTKLFDWRQDFGSLDLQTSLAMHGNGLMGVGLRSAVRSGSVEAIFEWSERARHLSQQVVPLRPPPDADLADDLAELRMLHAEGDRGRASRRAAELQTRARERQWSTTKRAEIETRADLADLQRELDEETAAFVFVFSADGLGVLAVTSTATRMITLEDWPLVQRLLPGLRADLDMAASIRDSPLAATVRRGLEDRLASLSCQLLDDAIAFADKPRVVLTVPGVLNGIPWSMLPAMRGRAFTVAVSISRWLRMRGPVAPATAGFAIGPRVARAAEEVAAAAAAWRAANVLDLASVPDVTGTASAVDVLHIAAHGRHAVDNPMFSGLELHDGTLFGYDIDLIEKVPDTVVLSACEVGRSSVRWGEEAVGMTRVWLHAGARCVIAAPVVVADDEACELLGVLHEGLARGASPSEALAAASARTGIIAPFQVHGAGF